jgi:hypothetical protein
MASGLPLEESSNKAGLLVSISWACSCTGKKGRRGCRYIDCGSVAVHTLVKAPRHLSFYVRLQRPVLEPILHSPGAHFFGHVFRNAQEVSRVEAAC